MAFTTRRTTAPVLTKVTMGAWEELRREGPRQADRGWDEVTVTLVGYFPTEEIFAVPLPFEVGDKLLLVQGEFYVGNVGPVTEWGGYHYLCEVYARGLVAPKAAFVTTEANTELFAGSMPGYPNAEVLSCTPAFEEEYIGSAPPTDTVGQEVLAPYAPGASFPPAPLPPWGFISDPTYHFPHNWVHESCVSESIAGTNLYLIRNRYRYQHEFTP